MASGHLVDVLGPFVGRQSADDLTCLADQTQSGRWRSRLIEVSDELLDQGTGQESGFREAVGQGLTSSENEKIRWVHSVG